MRKQVKKKIGGILLLPALLSAGIFAGPTSMNIKIRMETARYRLEPDSAAGVTQERNIKGTEFDAQRKNGDLPDVKLPSESAVRLLAYIHESDVDLVTEEHPGPKQILASTSRAADAEKQIGMLASKSLVLSLGGGPVFSSTGNGVSNYMSTNIRYLHPYEALLGLTDSNTLTLSLEPPAGAGFGLGLTYFLWPNLGIQFRIDIMSNRAIVDGLNEYTMTWKWQAVPTSYTLDPSPTWPIAGHLRAQPASLGLLVRRLPESRLQPYLQAGIAYFMCRFKAESQIGYAQTWLEDPYQYVDYFALPVSIDENFNALGFMGGAGLEWFLGSKTAVFVQADYFAGPSQEVGWAVEPGTYSAHFSSKILSIDENDNQIIRLIPPFTVKVGSLFRFLAGIKIILF